MLTNFKTFANPRNIAILAVLAGLTGCGGYPWEESFWTLPPASGVEPIKEGPAYPIERAEGSQAPWPALSNIPNQRPAVPVTVETLVKEQQQLEKDRAEAAGAVK